MISLLWIAIVAVLGPGSCVAVPKPWSESACEEKYHFHFHQCFDILAMRKCHHDHLNDRFRLHPCSSVITKNPNATSLFVSLPCDHEEYASCFHKIPAIVRNSNITKVFLSEMGDGWLPSKIRYRDKSSFKAFNLVFNSNSTQIFDLSLSVVLFNYIPEVIEGPLISKVFKQKTTSFTLKIPVLCSFD